MDSVDSWDVSIASDKIEFSSDLLRVSLSRDVVQDVWTIGLLAEKPLINKWDGSLTDEGLITDTVCESFEEAWVIAGETLLELSGEEYEVQGSNWHINIEEFGGETRREVFHSELDEFREYLSEKTE